MKMATGSSSAKHMCPHCDSLLSKKTFEAHKRLYYDESSFQWIKKGCTKEPLCDFDEPSLELYAFQEPPDHSDILSSPNTPPPLVNLEQPLIRMTCLVSLCLAK